LLVYISKICLLVMQFAETKSTDQIAAYLLMLRLSKWPQDLRPW